ncbi:PPE domain-containing protein [Saccharothrix sp. 6-C]|uniref:PPE domain-containing protein n=1 Tax=Saccharothrix sp. 6-C TaxID=2781735 RepID=UPI0019176E6D|nr:PPE domain-containing protein [Saccharothrix sp. 6-C]QQQ75747.1 PPE domain-containing protein [Saccharothrix sp. 6-C]
MPDGHRWSGYSHEELYEQINSGPGPKASHASMERWQGVSAALTEINADLHAGVLKSGASWEGSAADKARTGINPLAAWADDARAGAEIMRVSAERQADYIAKARADMPPPVKVTAEQPNLLVSALTALVGGQTDYEKQEKAQNAAEQRAREVMTTYASSTTSNTSTLGQFHQPPQLVINAPDLARNDSAGVSGPGWGYGGPRGWRGGGGRGGWRGGRGGSSGRGGYPAPRPVTQPSFGGSTGTSSAGTSGSTRASSAALPPSTSSTGAFGPGGVIGGTGGQQDKDRRKAGSSSSSSSGAGSASDTTSGQHAAGANQHLLPGAGGGPLPSGTTSVSSVEIGAFAASTQHAATAGPGAATGAMPGAAGQAGGGDTVHKRSVAAPVQPAFDPFGGLGGPRGAEEEEDATHDAADYLRETDDIYGIGGIISPPVIGESTTH